MSTLRLVFPAGDRRKGGIFNLKRPWLHDQAELEIRSQTTDLFLCHLSEAPPNELDLIPPDFIQEVKEPRAKENSRSQRELQTLARKFHIQGA